MRVKITVGSKKFKVRAGDIFTAERYRYDPDKVSLLKRESDGFEPQCNWYKESLIFMPKIPTKLKSFKPMVEEIERERNIYKVWANLFRELLAPLAWLNGAEMPNETEKAIIQFDEQKPK